MDGQTLVREREGKVETPLPPFDRSPPAWSTWSWLWWWWGWWGWWGRSGWSGWSGWEDNPSLPYKVLHAHLWSYKLCMGNDRTTYFCHSRTVFALLKVVHHRLQSVLLLELQVMGDLNASMGNSHCCIGRLNTRNPKASFIIDQIVLLTFCSCCSSCSTIWIWTFVCAVLLSSSMWTLSEIKW